LAAVLRIALVGGSDSLRASRRTLLESQPQFKIIYDSDGFGLKPQDLLEVNFDLLILDQRLDSSTAFDFIKLLHAIARVGAIEVGRILVSSQFSDRQLRLSAIEAGAVDCMFISDGIQVLLDKVHNCVEKETDFAIRELLTDIESLKISQDQYQNAAVALDTLDAKEAKILRSFCELKTDSQISVAASVPKLKVKTTLLKVQNLLMLDTRSQLLLKMHSLGALAL
jgi:DNA-binding NarL/FixJ family response regulator